MDVYALIPFALVILTMGMEVGILPFCSQSRRSGRRRDGRQTAIVRYHMGHHFPGSPAFFRAGNPLPHDGFRVDGSGLRRKPRLRSMGRGDHFPRRLHGDSLCTPAGTGTGPDLCRVQGLQRRNYGSFGQWPSVLPAFYETSFGVGWVFVGNLIASLLTLLAITHHDEPHSAPYRRQVAAAGARLFTAADGQRHRRHGQRIHIPPDDQVPRTGRCDGRSGYLRSDRQNRYGAHAFRADVPVGRRTLLPGRL